MTHTQVLVATVGMYSELLQLPVPVLTHYSYHIQNKFTSALGSILMESFDIEIMM